VIVDNIDTDDKLALLYCILLILATNIPVILFLLVKYVVLVVLRFICVKIFGEPDDNTTIATNSRSRDVGND